MNISPNRGTSSSNSHLPRHLAQLRIAQAQTAQLHAVQEPGYLPEETGEERELWDGNDVPGVAMISAFADFMDVEVANGDASADTLTAYKREVTFYIKWCWNKNIDPAKADRNTIIAYREYLKNRKLKVSTRAHKLSIVRRFYDAAVRKNLIESNPAERVRGGKDMTPAVEKMKALTKPALRKLIQNMPKESLTDLRDRAILALFSIQCLRRQEIHNLNHENLQTTVGKNKHGEEVTIGILHFIRKGNVWDTQPLRDDVYDAITDYIQAKLEAGLPLSKALFLAHGNRTRGKRISRRALNWIVDKHLTSAGLKKPGVSCHALRHTGATLAVSGGAKIEHVQKMLNHRDINTTMVYVEARDRMENNPAFFIDVELS